MLRIADKTFESHLFTGTGKFAAPEVMVEAIRASGSQLVTCLPPVWRGKPWVPTG